MTEVIHITKDHLFLIPTGDLNQDNVPRLEYTLLNNHINFTHTYVPFRLRGKGFAEALVKTGLTWAKENNLSIQTSCWYVEKYMKENGL